MNNRFNAVPVVVQQIVEEMTNPNTPASVRFNHQQRIETIREYCTNALEKLKKNSKKR